MTDNLLALLDVAIRLATAVAWIGITILAGAGCYVAGCLAWAACRIGRGVRRRVVRRAARIPAADDNRRGTDHIALITCRSIAARGVADTREGDPR
jgi:CRISPR/Cas system Type II protein with McrA/HNH and RuvC-like nuclease domain